MIATQIVNRIKEILPKYTDDFTSFINITSLSKSGSNIIAVSTGHNLESGDYVMVKGAKEPITITSLTYSNGVATAICNTEHKLADPNRYIGYIPKVEITSPNSDYTGVFNLLSVIDYYTFTFKPITTPSGASTGYLLLEDQEGYNGYKVITKINDDSFSYTSSTTLQSPAQGTLKASVGIRVDSSATRERIIDFYDNLDGNNSLESWLFVVVEAKEMFKNEQTASNITGSKKTNESYRYDYLQNFSIFSVTPSKNSILAGDIGDIARSYEKPLLKALANYIFDSDLTENKTQPCIYIGEQPSDYLKSYYMHRFDFAIRGSILQEDTIEFSNGVLLKRVEGNFKNGVEFKLNV